MNRLANKPVADAHVDVLMRMDLENQSFFGETGLQAGAHELAAGDVKTQVFAVFVSPKMAPDAQLHAVLRQIDIFHNEVTNEDENVQFVTGKQSLKRAHSEGRTAGLLSVEGAACLGGDTRILSILHRLGVRGVGLTWNGGNDLADGCRESRGGGLTRTGRAIVQELERLSMWIDVAHLSDMGVFDIFNTVRGTVMASHANCRRVHDHPRNLTDETIREIIRRNGWIGLTFEASFVADEPVSPLHVFHHLDHILSLGGHGNVGFGSDFDGTSHPVKGLSCSSDYAKFADLVFDRYGEVLGKQIMFENFEGFLSRQLPD
jgi:membrane dipeptidase